MEGANVVPFHSEKRTTGRERRTAGASQESYSTADWGQIEDHLWRASRELRLAVEIFCRTRQGEKL